MNTNEMTEDQILKLCTEQLEAGISLGEVLRSMNKQNNLTPEQKKSIVDKLNATNKELKRQKEIKAKKSQRIAGIVEIVIGVIVYFFSAILFKRTSEAGFIYTINIVFYIVSGVLVTKGVIDLIKGNMKD